MERDRGNATANWSIWCRFPDPPDRGVLTAPFGPGCYELRRSDARGKVLFGRGRNVAYRMTSLLPKSWGAGTRHNYQKRDYVFEHLDRTEYRTIACTCEDEAKQLEVRLKAKRESYRFPK